MLKNMSLLFLSCRVLILNDHDYISRFWCKYESYLSMQMPTPTGMATMHRNDVRSRHRMVLADERLPPSLNEVLMDTWLTYTGDDVEAVIEHLSSDSIIVTSQKDKEIQFAELRRFDQRVKDEANLLGLSGYVQQLVSAADVAPQASAVAAANLAKAEKLEREAEKAIKLGQAAEAAIKKREAQRARNVAARERVSAENRTETFAKSRIEPVFRKLRKAEEKNRTLVSEKKNLEAQLQKLEEENKTLRQRFYQPIQRSTKLNLKAKAA